MIIYLPRICTILLFFLLSNTQSPIFSIFFFFNDTATTEIYTLSLHDALPIWSLGVVPSPVIPFVLHSAEPEPPVYERLEEHTSELQSHLNLVCRLLLEKKKKKNKDKQEETNT